jgi:hypothetical protein
MHCRYLEVDRNFETEDAEAFYSFKKLRKEKKNGIPGIQSWKHKTRGGHLS